ncbi:MAG: hemolysin family protein [Proteobacteria bacterium]|nr:hemolysin family protein [Pseudomonadota bacterium]MBU6426225.1 hemolysin family protein [Rhodospirillales bacterium]
MSGALSRLLGKLRSQEQSVRESIAELVQQQDNGAEDIQTEGESLDLNAQERALIGNVLRLRDITADDVMIPRPDIVAMKADVSLDEALALIRKEGHSRMPVYREHLDDVAGMVHIKDVFGFTGAPAEFSIDKILRKPLMVAPQIAVLDLLLQMRQMHTHLALVVDEYGGIDGLVTIEDLVETIVGDISDEHDEIEGPMLTERADGAYDINARLPIEAFEEKIGPVLSDDEREADIETVGGLVFNLAERVPTRGEIISHPAGVEFMVLDADARRIRKLRARRVKPDDAPPEDT